MRERICTCRQFQMNVMSCKHVLSIVRKYYTSEYEYCSVYYKNDNILNTYEVLVYPIPDESIWGIPPDVAANIVLPPKGKIKLGRPKKIRYKTVVNQDQRSQELHAECVDNKITIGRHAETFHRQLSFINLVLNFSFAFLF